jgi:hypothetical protein
MKQIAAAMTVKALSNEFARQALAVALEKRGIKRPQEIADLIEAFMEAKFEQVREANNMPPLQYGRPRKQGAARE